MNNAAIAQSLAERGITTFPCYAADGPDVTAKRCVKGVYWRTGNVPSPAQVDAWWRGYPDALPALHLGKMGLLVIDCDRHAGGADGVAAFEALCAEHDYAPPEYVETPSGGRHYYFLQPEGDRLGNSPGSLPKGIDVRGDGGYVIAPGSTLPDGRAYTDLASFDAPALPAWLRDILLGSRVKIEAERKVSPAQAVAPVGGLTDRQRRYVETAVSGELDAVRSAPTGQRNAQLNTSSLKLGALVGAGLLAEGEAVEALATAARDAGLSEPEIMPTIKSGMGKGKTQPRELPEDRGAEMAAYGAQIAASLLSAKDRAAEAWGVEAVEAAATDGAPEGSPVDLLVYDGTFSLSVPPSIIRHLLPRNGLVIDGGQSGAGKSFAEIDMSVAIASGQDWLGQPIREKVGVVYLAAEGQATIQRRIIAAKRART